VHFVGSWYICLSHCTVQKTYRNVAINCTSRYRQTWLAFPTFQFTVCLSFLYRLNLLWGLPILILSWSSERKPARNVKLSVHIYSVPRLLVRGIILYLPSNTSSCLTCKETALFVFSLNGSGFPKELNRLRFHALTCHLERRAQTFSEIFE